MVRPSQHLNKTKNNIWSLVAPIVMKSSSEVKLRASWGSVEHRSNHSSITFNVMEKLHNSLLLRLQTCVCG